MTHRLLAPRALLWAAMVSFATGFASLSILRHRAFNTGRFDLGNLVQAVWTTAHGDFLQQTALNGRQISRLGVHFEPILAAFAPLWYLWPSPDMLLTVQAVAVALGALPVFWLARKHLHSERAALGFALVYLVYPPLQWMALDEFHPGALACPLLLFAFWYLDEDRLVPFAVFALIACTTREEIALVVAGLGVWYALSRRRWITGSVVAVAGAAVAAIVIGLVTPHFRHGAPLSFYGRYKDVGGSPSHVLRTIVTHPLTRCARSRSPSTGAGSVICSSSRSRLRGCVFWRRSRCSQPCPCSLSTSSRERRHRRRSTTTTPQARSRRCSWRRSSARRASRDGGQGSRSLSPPSSCSRR